MTVTEEDSVQGGLTQRIEFPPEVLAAVGQGDDGDEIKVSDDDFAEASRTDEVAVTAELVETFPDVAEAKGSRASLNRSPRSNWVEETGELPGYIREIARSISTKRGIPLERAIPIAIGVCKRWARGGGDVNADTRAKAAAAIAQWEALKAKNRARMAGKKEDDAVDIETRIDEFVGDDQAAASGIEYKDVGAQVVDAQDTGVVTAIVSVTGIEDKVGDVIEPGAYAKTLTECEPLGVWGHDWKQPISKTLEARELLPGDPALPATMRQGTQDVPWPAEAGALLVKMQFNMSSTRGREAYEDVKFFGPSQGWSIGYTVPAKTAKYKGGKRYLPEVKWLEYSAVLHGANPAARTVSVKSAQAAYQAAMSALTVDELAAVAALRSESETKAEESTSPDPKAPHKFQSDDDGKCKVCGMTIGGHFKAQKESASGEKVLTVESLLEMLDDVVQYGLPPAESLAVKVAPPEDDEPLKIDDESTPDQEEKQVQVATMVDLTVGTLHGDGTVSMDSESKSGAVFSRVNAGELRKAYDSLGALLRRAGLLDDAPATAEGKAVEEPPEDPIEETITESKTVKITEWDLAQARGLALLLE